MHPLSLFPSLLTYQLAGPFILRIVLGATLAYAGYQKVRGRGTSSGSNSARFGYVIPGPAGPPQGARQ